MSELSSLLQVKLQEIKDQIQAFESLKLNALLDQS